MKKIKSLCLCLIMAMGCVWLSLNAYSATTERVDLEDEEYASEDITSYKGNVGEYEITMNLKTYSYDEDNPVPTVLGVTGEYTYVKAGNTLNLSGEVRMWAGMDENPYPIQDYPIYELIETTKSGKQSGEWVLYSREGGVYGELRTNGKVFKVNLKEVK